LAWLVDLEKAYDSTWREGLMVKLYNMGIKGKIWRWINNRFVYISIDNPARLETKMIY
jgi:hypothetical protein